MFKLILGLLFIVNILVALEKTEQEAYTQVLYKAIGVDKYYDKIKKEYKKETVNLACPYSQPSEIEGMPFFVLLDVDKEMCTTFRLKQNSMIPDYTEMKNYIDDFIQ